MIYGYLRTSRTAVDGLAGIHPETQLQALADAGVEPANIFQDVGISGSVLVGDRPGWTGLEARQLRGDTLTVVVSHRICHHRVDLVGVVESLHRRGVYLASLVYKGRKRVNPRLRGASMHGGRGGFRDGVYLRVGGLWSDSSIYQQTLAGASPKQAGPRNNSRRKGLQ